MTMGLALMGLIVLMLFTVAWSCCAVSSRADDPLDDSTEWLDTHRPEGDT